MEKIVPLCELHCSECIASFFALTKQGAAETFVHSDILAYAAHKFLKILQIKISAEQDPQDSHFSQTLTKVCG